MGKAGKAAILGAILLVTGCVSVEWNPETYLVPQLMPTAVTVKTWQGSGSGVWVTDQHVLTAKHVVEGFKRVTVVALDGTKVDGWVSAIYDGRGINEDWAIIRTEGIPEGAAVAKWTCETPVIGERLIMIGNSLGVTGLLPYFGWLEWLDYDTTAHSAPAHYWKKADLASFHGAPGTSGGPIFNRQGKLIGLEVGSMGGRGGTFKQVLQPVRSTFLCGK